MQIGWRQALQNSGETPVTKTLDDYRAQAGRPFEHEARLTELLARQAELNAALDLEKGDQQAAAVAPSEDAAA